MKRGVILALVLTLCFVFLVSASYQVQSDQKGRVSISIKKGWNLVPLASFEGMHSDSQMNLSDFRYIYIYLPSKKDYVLLVKDGKEVPESERKLLEFSEVEKRMSILYSLWAYSERDGEIGIDWTNSNLRNYPAYEMIGGWNFIWATPDMKGIKFEDFKGNCNILKICGYQNKHDWECVNGGELRDSGVLIDNDWDIGNDVLVKVSSNCILGDMSEFPRYIGGYNLTGNYVDSEDCDDVAENPKAVEMGLTGEVCVKTRRVSYSNYLTNKGTEVQIMNITKGRDVFERFVEGYAKDAVFRGKNVKKLVDRGEISWFTLKEFVVINEYENVQVSGGVSRNYLNVSESNPVVIKFLDKYK